MQNGFFSLKTYQLAYRLALEIHVDSKKFPAEEKYALTDQIRRSSRSVCANIAEGYRKRMYVKHFLSKFTDADGETSETMVWLQFAKDFGYLSIERFQYYMSGYEEVGKMLCYMMENPQKFGVKVNQ